MTGCLVVVLGATGRNFAAGMSGGIAYVLDSRGDFKRHDYNREMVHLEAVKTADDIYRLHDMITKHHAVTKSRLADRILNAWPDFLPRFIKVIPVEYQRVLAKMKREKAAAN
jgi:glutamate synthase (NADPH/NADH) large chain